MHASKIASNDGFTNYDCLHNAAGFGVRLDTLHWWSFGNGFSFRCMICLASRARNRYDGEYLDMIIESIVLALCHQAIHFFHVRVRPGDGRSKAARG